MSNIRDIILIICTFSVLLISPVEVQSSSSNKLQFDSLSIKKDAEFTSDSLFPMPSKRNKNGLISFHHEWIPLDNYTTFSDTIIFDPLFLPIVFEGNVLPHNLDFRNKTYFSSRKEPRLHLISPDSTLTPYIQKKKEVRRVQKEFYLNPENMGKVKYSKAEFARITPMFESGNTIKKNPFHDLISADDPRSVSTPSIKRYAPRPVHWLFKGEHRVQIAQNHISDNWYKGGNSNFNVSSNQKLLFNYRKEKVSFDNTIEWKLSMQNSSGDTLRKINFSEDLFRTYSVFGYKAYENWSYSGLLELKTQFFNIYQENKAPKVSAFLAPLDVNIGIGMSYKIDKKFKDKLTKKLKWSLSLSPLSVNFRYVGDKDVDETKFKLKKGRNTKTDLGSLVNSDLNYTFNSFVSWNSRFKYFTDYKSVISEFENTLDISLNKYFSTTLYLYLRYDETSKKDDSLRYLQINEVIKFGLNYKW